MNKYLIFFLLLLVSGSFLSQIPEQVKPKIPAKVPKDSEKEEKEENCLLDEEKKKDIQLDRKIDAIMQEYKLIKKIEKAKKKAFKTPKAVRFSVFDIHKGGIFRKSSISLIRKNYISKLYWSVPYSYPISETELKELRSNARPNTIMCMGAIHPLNKDEMHVMACGKAIEILQHTHSLSKAQKISGAYWYWVKNRCIGFAPTSKVNLYEADSSMSRSKYRVSWHINRGGWRIGEFFHLNDNKQWQKVVWFLENGKPAPGASLNYWHPSQNAAAPVKLKKLRKVIKHVKPGHLIKYRYVVKVKKNKPKKILHIKLKKIKPHYRKAKKEFAARKIKAKRPKKLLHIKLIREKPHIRKAKKVKLAPPKLKPN